MCRWKLPFFYRVVVVGGMFAVAATVAVAATPPAMENPKAAPVATCELKLKQLEPLDDTLNAEGKAGTADKPGDQIYREVGSQYLGVQFVGKDREGKDLENDQLAEFRKVVKKEPKYQSKQPLRAVAMLGGKPYAFAIDQKDSKSTAYSRLYFDANGNGDLTDDTPIDVKANPASASTAAAGERAVVDVSVSHEFPQVKAMLDIGGVKVDYAFSMHVYADPRDDDSYARYRSPRRPTARARSSCKARSTASSCWISTATVNSTTRWRFHVRRRSRAAASMAKTAICC